MQQWIKIYYSIFIWSSTCLWRHTAHHQEPKTALAASGFSYVEGCWTRSCWTLSGNVHQLHVQQPSTYGKPEAANAVLGILMMGGVSPETCWASFKYGIIKFWYIVASCWIFLYETYYDARIHEHRDFINALCKVRGKDAQRSSCMFDWLKWFSEVCGMQRKTWPFDENKR